MHWGKGGWGSKGGVYCFEGAHPRVTPTTLRTWSTNDHASALSTTDNTSLSPLIEDADGAGVAVAGDTVGEGVSAGVGAGRFGSWVTDEDAVALGVLDKVTELVGEGVPVIVVVIDLDNDAVAVREGVTVLVGVIVCVGVGGAVMVGVIGTVCVGVYALLGVGVIASCATHPAVVFTVCAHALVKLVYATSGCMYVLKKTSLAPAR